MGEIRAVGITLDAALDDQYGLQRFSAAMHSGVYSTRVEGRRLEKNVFSITAGTSADTRTFKMEMPENVVLYSPMLEMSMQRLALGKQLRFRTIDPLSLTLADVVVEGAGRERILLDKESVTATKVKTRIP